MTIGNGILLLCFQSKLLVTRIKAFGYECIQNYWTTERTDGTELLGLGWMLLCYYEWGWNSAHPLHLLHTAMAITQYWHKSVNKSSVLYKITLWKTLYVYHILCYERVHMILCVFGFLWSRANMCIKNGLCICLIIQNIINLEILVSKPIMQLLRP